MRTIIRLFLVMAVLAVVAIAFMAYWPSTSWSRPDVSSNPTTGTTGVIAKEKAREVGAEIGEQTAVAAKKVREQAYDAGITAKITAKMALDDLVKARHIDVSTDGSTVTLSGTTESVAEHDRAIALARETDGVTRVIDRLQGTGTVALFPGSAGAEAPASRSRAR